MQNQAGPSDVPYDLVISCMIDERGSYNSVTLHEMYKSEGGSVLCILISKVARLYLFTLVSAHIELLQSASHSHVYSYVTMNDLT